MAFTHRTLQHNALKKKVETAALEANGQFIRFLDALAAQHVQVHPRWVFNKDSSITPLHTFHLEPLRFGAEHQELDGIDWDWLLTHLDYPHEAKERLLALARSDALTWVESQPLGKVSNGEKRVGDALHWLFGQPFPKARPAWLTMPGFVHPYELDGFCEPLRLAFEFQGDQHYEAVERYAMNDDDLVKRQRTDAWKRHEVFQQKVYLLEVTHSEVPKDKSHQAMATLLLNKLNSNGTARKYLASVNTPHGVALRDSLGFKV